MSTEGSTGLLAALFGQIGEIGWVGGDFGASGGRVATGVYFIRLVTDKQTFTRKAVLLK